VAVYENTLFYQYAHGFSCEIHALGFVNMIDIYAECSKLAEQMLKQLIVKYMLPNLLTLPQQRLLHALLCKLSFCSHFD